MLFFYSVPDTTRDFTLIIKRNSCEDIAQLNNLFADVDFGPKYINECNSELKRFDARKDKRPSSFTIA
jgi:hypothetical protein